MRKRIKKCKACGQYTLKNLCVCGEKTFIAHPPKFSPLDKYAKYRREVLFERGN